MVSDPDRAGGQRHGRVELCAIPEVEFEHRIARTHLIAWLGHDDDADGEIDRIRDTVPACAENDRCASDEFGVQALDKAAARRGDQMPSGHTRQAGVIVDDPRIATLQVDDLAEALESSARCDGGADPLLGVSAVGGHAGEHEHPGGESRRLG